MDDEQDTATATVELTVAAKDNAEAQRIINDWMGVISNSGLLIEWTLESCDHPQDKL